MELKEKDVPMLDFMLDKLISDTRITPKVVGEAKESKIKFDEDYMYYIGYLRKFLVCTCVDGQNQIYKVGKFADDIKNKGGFNYYINLRIKSEKNKEMEEKKYTANKMNIKKSILDYKLRWLPVIGIILTVIIGLLTLVFTIGK